MSEAKKITTAKAVHFTKEERDFSDREKERVDKAEIIIGYFFKNKSILHLALPHIMYPLKQFGESPAKTSGNERMAEFGIVILQLVCQLVSVETWWARNDPAGRIHDAALFKLPLDGYGV